MFRQPRPPLATVDRLRIAQAIRTTADYWTGWFERGGEDVITADTLAPKPFNGSLEQVATVARAVAVLFPGDSPRVEVDWASDLPDGLVTQIEWTRNVDSETTSGEPHLHIRWRRETADDPLIVINELAMSIGRTLWAEQTGTTASAFQAGLFPVFIGAGVLAAKASLIETHWRQSGFSGWSMRRGGSLSALQLGAAMAMWCWRRGKSNPPWRSRLRLDARTTFAHQMAWMESLRGHGCEPFVSAASIPGPADDPYDLAKTLADSPDPLRSLAAGEALSHRERLPASLAELLLSASHQRDDDLAAVAAGLLGRIESAPSPVVKRIERLIDDRRTAVAITAIGAADRLALSLNGHQPTLRRWLWDDAIDLKWLLSVIERQGRLPETRLVRVRADLTKMLGEAVRVNDANEFIQTLRRTIDAITT